MKIVPGNLVAQTLGGDDGDFVANPLVGVEIQRQFGVVFFNDDARRLFDGFRTNTTLENANLI